jgi:hypothetical protein
MLPFLRHAAAADTLGDLVRPYSWESAAIHYEGGGQARFVDLCLRRVQFQF